MVAISCFCTGSPYASNSVLVLAGKARNAMSSSDNHHKLHMPRLPVIRKTHIIRAWSPRVATMVYDDDGFQEILLKKGRAYFEGVGKYS